MNERPDPNDALSAAGQRLRATAPDAVATRRALASVRTPNVSTSGEGDRRPWGALAMAVMLAGAAVAAAFLFIGRPSQDTVRVVPADTGEPMVPEISGPPTGEPTPVSTVVIGGQNLGIDDLTNEVDPAEADPSAPQVSSPAGATTVTYEFRSMDCFRMSLDTTERRIGSAAGCIPPERLRSDEWYVTEMAGEVYAVERLDEATPPTLSIDPIPDWETSTCGIVEAFANEPADDSVIEIVACDTTVPDMPSVIAAWIPQEEGSEPDYFAHGVRVSSGDVALTSPTALAGMPGVSVVFGAPHDGVRCAAVLPQASAGWSEQCWSSDQGPDPAVARIDTAIAQIDLTDATRPAGVYLDVRGIPSTGCSLQDLEQMYETIATAFRGVSFTGLACTDTQATADFASVLLRNVGADGGFMEYERADAGALWTSIGGGTAGEALTALHLPPHSVWSSWPGQTASYPANEFRAGPLEGRTFDDAADAADAIVARLDELSTDEFPLNPRVLAGADGLIVIQSDVNDDDSVAGDIDYVHVRDVQGGGVEVTQWFTAYLCRRGEPGPTKLCV